MFIETDGGNTFIPLSSVIEVFEARGDTLGRMVVVYKGADGISNTKVSRRGIEVAIRRMSPLIPALPGTYLVHFWSEAGEHGITSAPIVAWRANEFGNLDPVTVEGESENYAILFPDGIVIRPEEQQWDSLAAFEEQMVKDHAEQQRK